MCELIEKIYRRVFDIFIDDWAMWTWECKNIKKKSITFKNVGIFKFRKKVKDVKFSNIFWIFYSIKKVIKTVWHQYDFFFATLFILTRPNNPKKTSSLQFKAIKNSRFKLSEVPLIKN